MKKVRGFSLIELIVVTIIMVVLFSLGIAEYNKFNRRQIVVQAAETLKNNLRLAQNKSLSGKKDCVDSLEGSLVTFASPDQYTIQSQCSSGNGPSSIYSLPNQVSFTTMPSSILFKVLAQGVEISGSSTISISGYGETQTLTISKTGEIY